MDPLLHEELCDCGARAAEEILKTAYGIDVRKALDPTDPKDFETIVARLSRALTRATASTEAEILRLALDNLDVDWRALNAAQRNKVVEAARSVLLPIPDRVLPAVEQQLSITGPRVVRGARRGQADRLEARFSSRINLSLTERDRRVTDHLVRTQSHYIRDEYGRRRETFSREARRIVAAGLEEGLGRDEIAESLERGLTAAGRSRAYWNVIASTFANRSRVWGNLASFREAGIERYVFEAVLDERTTDQCAALHGRTFETERAIRLYEEVEASPDPEAVRDITPWLRVGRDGEGRRVLFTEDRSGRRTTVAEVTQSRVGQRDALPQLRNMRSSGDLAEMGLVMPPLHANCRSTIVADV